ncbi:hypothetical protein SELMODRAFT_131092 [Selaginella moellendorffii]|uniref:Pentacotripeptide-repeat region of PRORP domain-containing protein n=1 Tax=Selaginella moellendorffii TaxID=88036 RepID=D8T3P2_SELML|nr:hypothetical protein SELMODRAFT_131092 [Selaginella moellendorffii]
MYGKCGCLQEAFAVFNGIPYPNKYSWKILLQLYIENGLLHSAEQTFRNMPVAIRDSDAIAWNAMMSAFALHGHLLVVLDLFHDMPHRTVVSWNTAIAALIQAASFEAAINAYERMPEHNATSGTAVLAAYGHDGYVGSVEDAKAIFDGLQERDVMAWTAMVRAYGLHGMLDEARAAFDKMPAWSIVTCTGLMVFFAEGGHVFKATNLFQAMPEHHIVSCSHMIKMYGSIGSLEQAKKIFDTMPERDLNGVSFTALLQAFYMAGSVSDMLEILERMPEKDLVSWVVMLKGYAENGHMLEAKEAFDRMPQHDAFSSNAMLAGLAQAGEFGAARDFFDGMPCRNGYSWSTMIRDAGTAAVAEIFFSLMPQWDLMSCGAMISAYAAVVDGIERAKARFETMVQRGADLWSSMFLATALCNYVILALMEKGLLQESRNIFDAIPNKAPSLWAVVVGYTRNGHTEEAMELFNRHTDCQEDTLAWNSIIALHATRGDVDQALHSAYLMELQGVEPDGLTFTTLLASCSKAGMVEQAWGRFMAMVVDYGLRASASQYRVMVDLVARLGMVAEAKELIDGMPFSPDVATWRTLLSACVVHHDASMGSWAAMEMAELDSRSSSAYVMVSGLCDTSRDLPHLV